MVLNQKYNGGDLIIPRETLEQLGVGVGDVLIIQTSAQAASAPLEPRPFTDSERQQKLKLLYELQKAWQTVDLSTYEEQREMMWQTWRPLS